MKNEPFIIYIYIFFIILISILFFYFEPSITGYSFTTLSGGDWSNALNTENKVIKITDAIYSNNKYTGHLEFKSKFAYNLLDYGSWQFGGFADDLNFDSNKAVFYIDAGLMKAYVKDENGIGWCPPFMGYDWQNYHIFGIDISDKTTFYIDGVKICSLDKIPITNLSISLNGKSSIDDVDLFVEEVRILE